MDWIKAIISFLLAIVIVGIGSLLISTVSTYIADFSYVAGSRSTNIDSFISNFTQYVLTILGISIIAPLIYVLLGGFKKEEYYEY